MTVIKIDNFGGEAPAISPRALPDNGAQVNNNLLLGVSEFRPVSQDSAETATAVAGSKSLYRIDPQDPWRTSAEDHAFVRAQVNSAGLNGRTFLTREGTPNPPRAIDKTGQNRQLGVPAPTVKPAVVVNVTDELSRDELADAGEKSADLIAAAIEANITGFNAGNGIAFRAPTPSDYGWISHETDEAKSYLLAPYVELASVSLDGSPLFRIQQGLEFLKSPALGGKSVSYGGATYWQIEVSTKARAYGINAAALQASLLAIDDPYVPGEKLLDVTSANFIATQTAEYYSAGNDELKPLYDKALEKTGLIDKVLSAATANDGAKTLVASQQYQTALEQLWGSGTTGKDGTVTKEVMSYLYVMVSNSFYYRDDNDPKSDMVNRYGESSKPLGWWSHTNDSPAAAYGRVRNYIIQNCITTPDGGLPYLDYDKLKAAVVLEYTSLANRRPTTESKQYYLGKLEEWAVKALAPLKAFFESDNLKRMMLGLTGDSVEGAFAQAVSEAGAALNALQSAYAIRRQLTRQIALNAYGRSEVSAKAKHVENAVIRLPDTRFYFYTYVTDWGEESAPSPVSDMVEPDQNDTVTVTMTAPPSGRHVTHLRLYRSNTGSQASAFQYVAYYATNTRSEGDGGGPEWVRSGENATGIPVANLVFEDTMRPSELGEVCPSVTWAEPPAGLQGLVGMPNGIMAGFIGNTIYFCEPYVPYAWPVEYQITTEHEIVGMGVFGQTMFVGTKGSPYFVSGSDSASMSAQKLESQQACVSRRSIVPVQGGVLFASPDGLCVADGSGVQLVSSGLFTREDWQKLQPGTIFAAQHENIYYLWSAGIAGGCLTFDLASKKLGRLDLTATAAYNDKLTDTLYVVNGTQILAVYGGTARRTGKWRSKRATLPQQSALAWAKVYGDQSPAAPVTLHLYGDGGLLHTATFTGLTPRRLPPGRWLEYEVEIESKARVTRVVLAGSTQELQSV